jgi:hypothetical protein
MGQRDMTNHFYKCNVCSLELNDQIFYVKLLKNNRKRLYNYIYHINVILEVKAKKIGPLSIKALSERRKGLLY